ncbi:MAG: PolC-type DNA polymerase III [Candidatus Wallbacteria bacterium]|nr:PolC-type DNA polymerase III [Candidatus Wallbacteria bacterium]
MPVYNLKPTHTECFDKALEKFQPETPEDNLRKCSIEFITYDSDESLLTFRLNLQDNISNQAELFLKKALAEIFPGYKEVRLSYRKKETPSFPTVKPTAEKATPQQKKNSSSQRAIMISELADFEGKQVTIYGEITQIEKIETKSGTSFIKLDVYDFTDSICVKTFKKDNFSSEKGDFVMVRGKVEFDKFEQEQVILAQRIEASEPAKRVDTAPEKRVELHMHSKLSAMDGMSDIGEIVATAREFGHKAIALTDHGVVQGYPDFYEKAREAGLKPIFGMEGYLIDDSDKKSDLKSARRNHINILVKNRTGLKNIYKLVSYSHLDDFYKKPRIRKSLLLSHREGLLLGTACEAGELTRAYLESPENTDRLRSIAGFYDFLEIMPKSNNLFLIREGKLHSEQDLERMNQAFFQLALDTGKLCVATGDSHYIHPHDAINREIIQFTQGYEESSNQAGLFFRTTDEMLAEFNYLGEEMSRLAVIVNPALIAAQIEEIAPIPKGFYPPKIANAEEELKKIVYENARMRYGDKLPEIVAKRLEKELTPICKHGFSDLYYIAHKIVKFSVNRGYQVGSRGSVGSSFVAAMADITEVNPLPPHYLCMDCGYSDFEHGIAVECGADLPDRNCPKCGVRCQKEGFLIPFEVFLGFEGDKVPDIDLNFSGEIQAEVHRYTESLFGANKSFKAGTINTFQDKAVKACIDKYVREKGIPLRKAEVRRLINECVGIKRTTGQHPGGIIVLPEDKEIFDFCPVQHPADDKGKQVITTHFDYHVMDKQLVKLDLLGHDNPTIIKMLEETTGLKADQIPLDDRETLKLFQDVKTLGVPEFGTSFVRQVLEDVKVKNFGDIVRVCGLTHGTDVWLNNAKNLVEKGKEFSSVITMRDDILKYLVSMKLPEKTAFEIMEFVRKGKFNKLKPEQIALMQENGVPEWYIESCRKIKYLFPKAHAVAYAVASFRIAYYKVHHPLAFYSTYFSIRPDVFDYESVICGREGIRKKINYISTLSKEEKTKRYEDLSGILEVAFEMCERGFDFLPISLESSDSNQFIVRNEGLTCPFSALDGVGSQAAINIVEAKKEKPFSSVEDLQIRAKLNNTVIEHLKKAHVFRDLPETEQLCFF